MNIKSLSSTVLFAMVLTACGGGSSGSPELPPVDLPLTVTAVRMTTDSVEGNPYLVILEVTEKAGAQTAFFKVVPDSAVFEKVHIWNVDGITRVGIDIAASAKAGHYTGYNDIKVCRDVECAKEFPGSPVRLPYDVTVKRVTGQVTPFKLSPLSALPGASDWATYQGNASHTAYQPVTLNANAFSPRWKLDGVQFNGNMILPSTIVTGSGRAFAALNLGLPDYTIRAYAALNEADGSASWSKIFSPEERVYGAQPPAYANGRVYGVLQIGSTRVYTPGQLTAFDAMSGDTMFKTGLQNIFGEHPMAPVPYSNKIYTTDTQGQLFAIDASTGSHPPALYIQAQGLAPAVDEQSIYVYANKQLNVIDTTTGVNKDKLGEFVQDKAKRFNVSPVIGNSGLVFATDTQDPQNNTIALFDTASKSVRWSVNGNYPGNPAYVDATLFAANNKLGRLEALNELDGSLAWSWSRPVNETFANDVLVTKNLVFVSTNIATYAIDRNSHQQVWSYPASGSLAVSANGILYIKGASSIIAINLH
jgi:outer membrane protein assembly factor BamB